MKLDRLANPEKYRLRKAEYHQENKEQGRIASKRYREKYPEKQQEKRRKWQLQNPGKCCAYAAMYKAQKLKATPPWADIDKIEGMYIEASRLGLSVDHVIPLRGDFVSGLHVETNLQYLPLIENLRKNKYVKELNT
jgi:hypothetical protein